MYIKLAVFIFATSLVFGFVFFFSNGIFAQNSAGYGVSSELRKTNNPNCECPPATDDALARLASKVMKMKKVNEKREAALFAKELELKLLQNELKMRMIEINASIAYRKKLIEKYMKLQNKKVELKRVETVKTENKKNITISRSEKLISIINNLKPKTAASMLSGMNTEKAANILLALSPERSAAIFQKMDPAKAAEITAFAESKKQTVRRKKVKTPEKTIIKVIKIEVPAKKKAKKRVSARKRRRNRRKKRAGESGFVFKPVNGAM